MYLLIVYVMLYMCPDRVHSQQQLTTVEKGTNTEILAHRPLQTVCADNDMCYVLYQADRDVITWNDAHRYCGDHHSDMAAVTDRYTQDHMSLFHLNDTLGDGHAWVGGRRSDNSTWYDVTNKPYTGIIRETYKISQTKCVQLYQNNASRTYTRLDAQICFTMTGHNLTRALCQYNITGERPCYGYNESGICYEASPSYARTWYQARVFCVASYPGGDLAYTSLSSAALRDYFWRELEDIPGIGRSLWVGIQRHGWHWVLGGEAVPVEYTAWYPDEGGGLYEDCVLVDLNANTSWADKACNYTSSYFICQYNVSQITDTTYTTVAQTSSSASTSRAPPDIETSTSSLWSPGADATDVTGTDNVTTAWVPDHDEEWPTMSTIVIICVVLGLLFIILLVGIILCFTREKIRLKRILERRKFRAKNRHIYGSPGRFPTTSEMGESISDWASILVGGRSSRGTLATVGSDNHSDTSSVVVRAAKYGTAVPMEQHLLPNTGAKSIRIIPDAEGDRATATAISSDNRSDTTYMNMTGYVSSLESGHTASRKEIDEDAMHTICMWEDPAVQSEKFQVVPKSEAAKNQEPGRKIGRIVPPRDIVSGGVMGSVRSSQRSGPRPESPDEYKHTIEQNYLTTSQLKLMNSEDSQSVSGSTREYLTTPIPHSASAPLPYIVKITIPEPHDQVSNQSLTGANALFPNKNSHTGTVIEKIDHGRRNQRNNNTEPIYAIVNKKRKENVTEIVDNVTYSSPSENTLSCNSNLDSEIRETLHGLDKKIKG